MNGLLLLGVLMFWVGQVESGPEQKAQSAARLKLMKETAARFEIRRDGAKPTTLELAAQPVLRWANPTSSFVVDGATFIWLADQRPEVIGAMWFKHRRSHFELHSLSPEPLSGAIDGTPCWSTSRPGIRWQAASDAPPAASRTERLRQMKRLAEDFGMYAVKTAPEFDEGSIWRYRMMAQPIHRYVEEAAVDGAIFALVQGTDPEAFLLLESRGEKGNVRWHFAFASACNWELHAEHREREVWSVQNWHRQSDNERVYTYVGPWAVDKKLLPPEPIKSKRR